MDMALSQLQKLKEQLGLKWHPKTRKEILKRRIITSLKRKENVNFEKSADASHRGIIRFKAHNNLEYMNLHINPGTFVNSLKVYRTRLKSSIYYYGKGVICAQIQ